MHCGETRALRRFGDTGILKVVLEMPKTFGYAVTGLLSHTFELRRLSCPASLRLPPARSRYTQNLAP